MGVSSYFEFLTTLFGWILYDNFWSVLADSGLVYVPFIVILFTNIVTSRRAGDDEGSAALQSLKKSETDIVIAIVVLFLAAVPFSDVRLGEMQYVRPTLDCAIEDAIASGDPATVNGAATNTSWDRTLSQISGQTGRIPIWWGFMHVMTKSVVAASVASIPCTGDLAAVELRLENDYIDDPRVNKELQEFIVDCYMPARSQFYRIDQTAVTPAQADSIFYLGSSYFLATNGYYNKFYSSKPRASFAFSATRDAGFERDAAVGGHPTCDQWWTSPANGLRTQVLNAIDLDTRNEYVYNPRNLISRNSPGLSVGEREDVLLRKYVAIRNAQSNVSGFSNMAVSYSPSIGEQYRAANDGGFFSTIENGAGATASIALDLTTNVVAGVGAIISSPGHLAAGIAARDGANIFVSLILMIFVCVLPFLMVFSLYRLATLMTLSIVFFGLHFFYVLWGIAFWVDNNLVAAIADGGFIPAASPMQTTIILWVQRFLYMIFPGIWLASLGWIGVKANTLMQGMNSMNQHASAPMQAGGAMATQLAVSSIKGGAKAA